MLDRFPRSLREHVLSGVRLVISDSHSSLVKAIRKVMIGAAWHRCRVHFVRNVEAVGVRLDTFADLLGRQFPEAKRMLRDTKEDLTAFADFPHQHWKKIHLE